jgi:hypothetical protein
MGSVSLHYLMIGFSENEITILGDCMTRHLLHVWP